MQPAKKMRPASFAGRMLAATVLLASGVCCALADTPDELLQHADQIKTANNSEFQSLVGQLDAQAGTLTETQRDFLDYLHAWQLGYQGEYAQGVSAFQSLLARTRDPTLQARTRISLINNQSNGAHYEDAYANLSVLLESLPQINDEMARNFSYAVAAILYNQAGQYDLALRYGDLWLADKNDKTAACKATMQKVESLYKLGKLVADDPQIADGIRECQTIGEVLYTNLMRIWQARTLIDKGHPADAVRLLNPHDAEELGTHSAASISEFRSVLARAYLLAGDLGHAREYAQSTVDLGIKQAYSQSVADAYEVLYEAAKQQGDSQAALAYHEKYATADKGYLNDTSARALAYQMVHQQVLDKKRQVDVLNEKNKVLQLQQQVDAKSAEARLLYILLLLSGLGLVALWAYRTKRSQMKFQKLARRDGLTGICNRQHFFESAQDTLRYCAKGSRPASVLVLDLDHFKSVNDMHGHAAGDDALKRVVAACQERLRSIDIFGRLGGEEFAILLPDCSEATAAQRAGEMREAIAGSRRSGDAAADVLVTASFGVADTRACGYNLPTLLAQADSALYQAKREGRNRVAVSTVSDAPMAAVSSI